MRAAPASLPAARVRSRRLPADERAVIAANATEDPDRPASFYVGDLLALDVPVRRIENWIGEITNGLDVRWHEDVVEVRGPAKTLHVIEQLLDARRESVRRSVEREYRINDILDDLRTLEKRERADPKWGWFARMYSKDEPDCIPEDFGYILELIVEEVVRFQVVEGDLCVRATPAGHVEVKEFFREYRKSVADDLNSPRESTGHPHSGRSE